MINLRIALLAWVCSSFLTVHGQNEIDALRFSEKSYSGSARLIGSGGAFGALGADFGALSINPAGVAIYRDDEFSFTPSLRVRRVNAAYEGDQFNAFESGLSISGCGIVNVGKTNDPQVNRISLAFGYNRTGDFNENISFSGLNSSSSLADVFVATANGTAQEDLTSKYRFGTGLAWVAYLINPLDENTNDMYVSAVPSFLEKTQTKTIERTGAMGETFLAFGSSVLDNLYLGGSIGFPTVRFKEKSVHKEELGEVATELASFTYTENLATSGNGINAKLGGIYRVSDLVRVGLAYHSRDFYGMTLTYSTQIQTTFRDGEVITADSPTGISEYRLRTPQRLIVSGAFLMGKSGFISADYEFVDYSTAKLRSRNSISAGEAFAKENETIGTLYRGTHNVRIGSEYKVNEFIALRLGTSASQNPFSNGVDRLRSFNFGYSAGAGVRFNGLFLDLAYTFLQRTSQHYLYDSALLNPASLTHNTSFLGLTVGFKY